MQEDLIGVNNPIVLLVDSERLNAEAFREFVEANAAAIRERGLNIRFDTPQPHETVEFVEALGARVLWESAPPPCLIFLPSDHHFGAVAKDELSNLAEQMYVLRDRVAVEDIKIAEPPLPEGRNWEAWNQAPRSARRNRRR